MITIKDVNLLIHPDDILFRSENTKLPHRIYLELLDQWDIHIQSIADKPNCILVEYMGDHLHSYLQDIESGTEGRETLSIEMERRNLRVNRYSELLGARYLPVNDFIHPYQQDWKNILAERMWTFDKKISIIAFGEFYEACVEQWAEEAATEFGKHFNVEAELSYPIPLSINMQDYRQFLHDIHYKERTLSGCLS